MVAFFNLIIMSATPYKIAIALILILFFGYLAYDYSLQYSSKPIIFTKFTSHIVAEDHDYTVFVTVYLNKSWYIRYKHDDNCINPWCKDVKKRNEWADRVLNPINK